MQYGGNDFSASECHFFIASPTLDRITLYARHKRNDMTMHSAYVFCIIFVCFLCARPAQGRVSSNGLRTIRKYNNTYLNLSQKNIALNEQLS